MAGTDTSIYQTYRGINLEDLVNGGDKNTFNRRKHHRRLLRDGAGPHRSRKQEAASCKRITRGKKTEGKKPETYFGDLSRVTNHVFQQPRYPHLSIPIKTTSLCVSDLE